MIAGHEVEILDTVETLMNARGQLKQIESSGQSRFDIPGFERTYITRGEFLKVLQARVAEYEQKAHDLGVYGPAAKQSARGMAIAIVHGNNPRATQ